MRDVGTILDVYLARTGKIALAAVAKLEKGAQTTNELQNARPIPAKYWRPRPELNRGTRFCRPKGAIYASPWY